MTDDGRDRGGNGGPASDTDLARRFETFSRALDVERDERARMEGKRQGSGNTGYALAVRMGSEFIAAVLVGAALGWGIDYFAGTSPWGLIVFLMLGFAAGVMNVLRSAGQVTSGPGGPDGKR